MTEVKSFLAIVNNVYPTNSKFLTRDKEDTISIHNKNEDFFEEDARLYGAITYEFEDSFQLDDYAFPFDKNNVTYPIIGETVLIIVNQNECFWLPYTNTQYPNYREDYKTSMASKGRNIK